MSYNFYTGEKMEITGLPPLGFAAQEYPYFTYEQLQGPTYTSYKQLQQKQNGYPTQEQLQEMLKAFGVKVIHYLQGDHGMMIKLRFPESDYKNTVQAVKQFLAKKGLFLTDPNYP